MTTVAYRDGIMSCDSCWTYNSCIDTLSNKILRLKSGALLGQSGDNDIREIIAAIDDVKTPKGLPTVRELYQFRVDFLGLLVFPNGKIYKIACTNALPESNEDDMGIWAVERSFTAIGSGTEFAIGAMASGVSSAKAVSIACQYDPSSRPPIHSIPLKVDSKPKSARRGNR